MVIIFDICLNVLYLLFTFSEQPFFLQNNQKPVVRTAELAFHTLLFCTLVIELFGMAFLLFKLSGKPCLVRIINRFQSKKQGINTNHDTHI